MWGARVGGSLLTPRSTPRAAVQFWPLSLGTTPHHQEPLPQVRGDTQPGCGVELRVASCQLPFWGKSGSCFSGTETGKPPSCPRTPVAPSSFCGCEWGLQSLPYIVGSRFPPPPAFWWPLTLRGWP